MGRDSVHYKHARRRKKLTGHRNMIDLSSARCRAGRSADGTKRIFSSSHGLSGRDTRRLFGITTVRYSYTMQYSFINNGHPDYLAVGLRYFSCAAANVSAMCNQCWTITQLNIFQPHCATRNESLVMQGTIHFQCLAIERWNASLKQEIF